MMVMLRRTIIHGATVALNYGSISLQVPPPRSTVRFLFDIQKINCT